jgi:putative membrane protein
MATLAVIAIAFVAIEHVFFLILEMFLWNTPTGRKAFQLTPEFAAQSQALAKNQGLYNGFLAAGLLWSLLHPDPSFALQLRWFFLGCVVVAGIYGAFTVKPKIFFLQALPALVAMGLVFAAHGTSAG